MTNLWRDKINGQYLLGNPKLLEYYYEGRFELIRRGVPKSVDGYKYLSKNDLRSIASELEISVRQLKNSIFSTNIL
jgi:hypothetical protein